jgi:GT2 family glycosyltransferase
MTGDAGVAVCIVTHDSAADLEACLSTVAALRPRPAEVAIVDCASSDDSVATARRAGANLAGLTIDALPDNIGFAGGMNRAVELTRAPWVLSLNADARPAMDYTARLLDRATAPAARRIGAATGRLLRPDGRIDACGMRLTWTWRHLDRGSGELDRGRWHRPERVFGATGAASLFRREALLDVALDGAVFCPEFHSYREDAELAFRLHERGWEVVYEPAAVARHTRVNIPSRRRDMSAAINRHSLRNRYLLRAYHQGPANFVWTLLPTLMRDAMALAWVGLAERSSRGVYGWLWRHRRDIAARRRQIRARRTEPSWAVDRWFFRSGRPW